MISGSRGQAAGRRLVALHQSHKPLPAEFLISAHILLLHYAMLYNLLKVSHIITAAMLIASMIASFRLWKSIRAPRNGFKIAKLIQNYTAVMIIPLAFIQLATGFTMISLKHYHISDTWIVGSVIGFIIVIGSWFSFVYFLILSQQATVAFRRSSEMQIDRFQYFRTLQSIMLTICAAGLLSMVFFMANKTA